MGVFSPCFGSRECVSPLGRPTHRLVFAALVSTTHQAVGRCCSLINLLNWKPGGKSKDLHSLHCICHAQAAGRCCSLIAKGGSSPKHFPYVTLCPPIPLKGPRLCTLLSCVFPFVQKLGLIPSAIWVEFSVPFSIKPPHAS